MNYVPPLLALDPGGSTGFCVFDHHAEVASYGTITQMSKTSRAPGWSSTRYLRDALGSLRTRRFDVVVIEQPPLSAGKDMRAVVDVVNEIFPQEMPGLARVTVMPGQWKPVTGKILIPFAAKTQHEKDAYRMGMFYYLSKGLLNMSEVMVKL